MSNNNPILIGNLAPFTGSLGWIGPTTRRGIEIALTEPNGINDSNILGKDIEILERDTETTVMTAINKFTELSERDVAAIIGPSSTPAHGLTDLVREHELPLVTPIAGTAQLDTIGGEWVWRTVPSDSIGARAQAKYAYNKLDHRRMGLAYEDDTGSRSFSGSVGAFFDRLGGTITEEVILQDNTGSYESQIRQLIASDAEVVSMTAGINASRQFLLEYASLKGGDGFDILLSDDVVYDEFVETVGEETMNDTIGQRLAPGPAYAEFASEFRNQYDAEPRGFSAPAYDAMNLIALAFVREGDIRPEAIPNNLSMIGSPSGQKVTTFKQGRDVLAEGGEINYIGASNTQNFNEMGDPLGSFQILSVTDGKWVEENVYSANELANELEG
jgi:branched-chain amino acid transport system substrate-binding protein